MKNITEVLIVLVYAAIVYTLVRPASQGPGLVTAFGSAFTSMLGSITGGTWTSGSSSST